MAAVNNQQGHGTESLIENMLPLNHAIGVGGPVILSAVPLMGRD